MGQNQAATTTILVREGKDWRQYLVVSDERVAIVHMTPALLGGWRLGRVDVQGETDWPGMTQARIVAWKMANDDGRTSVVTLDADPTFREKLLASARGRQ